MTSPPPSPKRDALTTILHEVSTRLGKVYACQALVYHWVDHADKLIVPAFPRL